MNRSTRPQPTRPQDARPQDRRPRATRPLPTRLLAIAVTTIAVVLALPGIAAAGGPTSVLLASPYTGSATALYHTDDDYGRLQALLGGPDLPEEADTVAEQTPGLDVTASAYVTATWLIHDVSVWRIDRIFLTGDEVWVVSAVSVDGAPPAVEGLYPGETGGAAAVWHRPTDPAALRTLLKANGLTPGSARANPGARGPAVAEPAVAEAAAPQAGPATAAVTDRSGWLWGIGGIVAGVLIGVVVARATGGRRLVPAPGDDPPGSDPPGTVPPNAGPARMQPIG